MFGILIFADFTSIGYATSSGLHAVVVFILGYEFLFKSILGRCDIIQMCVIQSRIGNLLPKGQIISEQNCGLLDFREKP